MAERDFEDLVDSAIHELNLTSEEIAEIRRREEIFSNLESPERSDLYERRALAQEQQNYQQEVIGKATSPKTIREFIRGEMADVEKATREAPIFQDKYGPMRTYWSMKSRASALEFGANLTEEQKKELEEKGIIFWQIIPAPPREPELKTIDEIEINEETLKEIYGEEWDSLPPMERFNLRRDLYLRNLEIRERNKTIEAKNDQAEKRRKRYKKELEKAEKNRWPVINELKDRAAEFASRQKMDYHFSQIDKAGGDLGEIAKEFFRPRSYHVLTKDYDIIFNAPGTNEEGREGTGFGDAIDMALRAYYIIGLCEKKEELQELKNSPGWSILFTSQEQETEWVGNIDQWESTSQRSLDTFAEENEARGKLTKKGNLWARKESLGERKRIREAVRDFVGGPDAEAAEEIAFRLFDGWGMSAMVGTEVERDSSGKIIAIQQEGFPTSNDLIKVADTRDWQEKQRLAKHPGGPKLSVGQIDRMVVDFLRFHKNPEGTATLYEDWWGLGASEAKKLGQLGWQDMTPNLLRDLWLRFFFAGREGGLFALWKTIYHDPKMLGKIEFWEGLTKTINVLFSDTVVMNGRIRGLSKEQLKARQNAEKIRIKQTIWAIIHRSGARENTWLTSKRVIDGFSTYSGEGAIRVLMKEAGYLTEDQIKRAEKMKLE